MRVHKRFQVWLVQLDPMLGREINKTRPCVIVSPDERVVLWNGLSLLRQLLLL